MPGANNRIITYKVLQKPETVRMAMLLGDLTEITYEEATATSEVIIAGHRCLVHHTPGTYKYQATEPRTGSGVGTKDAKGGFGTERELVQFLHKQCEKYKVETWEDFEGYVQTMFEFQERKKSRNNGLGISLTVISLII